MNIRINAFKNRDSGEIKFCVMQTKTTHFVFDASEWDMVEGIELEGVERIMSEVRTVIEETIMGEVDRLIPHSMDLEINALMKVKKEMLVKLGFTV